MLQIVEVQHPAAALGLLVGRLKGRHQPEQLLYRLPHCRQVPQQRGAVPGEPLRHLGHLLFALVPQPLHLLPQADIFYFPGRLQLIETDACLGRRRIPSLPGSVEKGVHTVQGAAEVLRVGLFQGGVPRQQIQRPDHLPPPVLYLLPGVLQQQGAPAGLGGVGDPFQFECLRLLPEPAGRVRVALDAAVDVQHNGFQPVVIPPGGQGIHQAGKVSLL